MLTLKLHRLHFNFHVRRDILPTMHDLRLFTKSSWIL